MRRISIACLFFIVAGSLVAAETRETTPKVPAFSVDYMDRSVPPGVDFYQYADGNWVKNNPVPADKARWTSFFELAERNMYLVHELLDKAATAKATEQSPERQVGDFYCSFMDTNRIEQQKFAPIAGMLRDIDQASTKEDLFKLLARLHEEGIHGVFTSGAGPDIKNSSIYAFGMDQGGLSLPDRDYYLKDSFATQREAYRNHLVRMFTLLGDAAADATNHANTVFDLETQLAKASRSRVDLRDPDKNYNKYTIAELAKNNPGIPWDRFLTDAGFEIAPGTLNKPLASLSYVIVGQPEFFDAVEKLLRERPLDDWKIYLRWCVLHTCAPYLHRDVELENFAFFGKVLSGQEQQEPRWKRGARTVDRGLGEALGKLYVDKHFPPQAQARMIELVGNIKTVFRGRLQKLDWMTDATRQKALAKFDRFTEKIGHPVKFRDYSSIQITRQDCLGNVLRAASFETRRQFVRVGHEVDKTEWHMTPITVNAYFNPSQNEIVFPAGILQPPFFELTADDAVNYGAIGVVIGHEITHGYDDEGRKFDAEGNLHDWWTKEDAEAFESRAQKVVDEYNAFEPLPGLHVNGKLTLGENIADLGGITIAYEALQRTLSENPAKRAKIDGLTPEQRFFISFAQIWRTNTREAEQRRLVTVDAHSPGRFRAYGPLLNFQPFYDAFGIDSSAPIWMAPEKRAHIW